MPFLTFAEYKKKNYVAPCRYFNISLAALHCADTFEVQAESPQESHRTRQSFQFLLRWRSALTRCGGELSPPPQPPKKEITVAQTCFSPATQSRSEATGGLSSMLWGLVSRHLAREAPRRNPNQVPAFRVESTLRPSPMNELPTLFAREETRLG